MTRKIHIQATKALLATLLLVLAACEFPGVYRIDIPQGNLLDQEKVEEVKVGMEPRQVRYLLGTPLINDTFNQDRWDYFYSVKHNNKTTVEHHLIIHFEEGKVASIDQRTLAN